MRIHVQSRPTSYTEIKEEYKSDIKAHVLASVVGKAMHIPHVLFLYYPPVDLTTIFGPVSFVGCNL